MPTPDIKEFPQELKKFNWGAFLLSWIWGLGNKTYIALISLLLAILSIIPFVGFLSFGFCLYLGIVGNELAWKNKEWNSIEHFNDVQKKWAIAGVIVLIALFAISFLLGMLLAIPALLTNPQQ